MILNEKLPSSHDSTANNKEHSFEILVVDDCPNVVKSLKRSLEHKGVAVTTATGGQECIDLALNKWQSDKPFDAIILDIHMPFVDGYSASSYLRMKNYPGLIISLTGVPDITDEKESQDAGIDCFLVKPIAVDAILSEIATYVLEKKENSSDN